jgi:hypothetical protein
MMKGDAALPFKDIIRNFDFFTQSVILSLVYFNRKFNPQLAAEGDYDVIARGATSLVAKEVRGIQTDLLATTLTPEDRDWIDEEEFIRQRLATRDMQGLMLSKDKAMANRSGRLAAQATMSELEKKSMAPRSARRWRTRSRASRRVRRTRRLPMRHNRQFSDRHSRSRNGTWRSRSARSSN